LISSSCRRDRTAELTRSPESRFCYGLARILYCLFWFCSLFGGSQAIAQQRALGVTWDPPAESKDALEQLYAYQISGISDIELRSLVKPDIVEVLNRFNFRIHYRIDQPYWRPTDIASHRDSLTQQVLRVRTYYQDRLSLQSINLLQHGAFRDTLFWHAWTQSGLNQDEQLAGVDFIIESNHVPLLDSSMIAGYRLTHITNADTLIQSDSFRGYYVHPDMITGSLRSYLKPLWAQTQDSSLAAQPIFFPSKWLNEYLSQGEKYRATFRALSEQASLSFPDIRLPGSNQTQAQNWAVLILIVLWASIAIHYGFVPTYRRTISRYFFHHNFFVNDIMYRRYRAPYTAVILIFQHALFLSLLLITINEHLLSTRSLQILQHHLPLLGYLSASVFGYLLIAGFFIAASSFLLLSWIYLVNIDINHYSQVLMLYAWPLQANFFVITIFVTMVMAGASLWLILIFAILAALIWLLAFFVTAIDLFQYTRKFPIVFGLASVGIYLALVTIGLIWMITNQSLWQTIDLALAYLS
jgi:hypothetical protein